MNEDKKANTRSSQIDVNTRIQECYKMYIEGSTTAELVQHCAEKWGLSTRQTGVYIARVKEQLAEQAKLNRAEELGVARARLTNLYKKVNDAEDYRTALSVQKELNTLYSLYEPPAPRTLQITGFSQIQLLELETLAKDAGLTLAEIMNELAANLKKKDLSHESN